MLAFGWDMLEIAIVREASMHLPPRLLIASGIMWHDIDPYNWLNKFYFCMPAVVSIMLLVGMTWCMS